MALVDRYLHAVKFWLPRKQKDDIIAELSEDLRSQIEDREAELGHPLTDAEVEPIGATGQPGVLVGELAEHQRHAHRHHQPSQIGAAQQQRRGREANKRGREDCRDEAQDWIVVACIGENGGRVGADAEERRLAQRDDAGQSENEIERQREQSRDQRFVD